MEAAANPLLLQMYQTLAGRIRRARYIANTSDERWSQAIAEHEEMLAALSERDGRALGDVLRRHLRNKCESVKTYLRAEAPAGN